MEVLSTFLKFIVLIFKLIQDLVGFVELVVEISKNCLVFSDFFFEVIDFLGDIDVLFLKLSGCLLDTHAFSSFIVELILCIVYFLLFTSCFVFHVTNCSL